jgi:hypothetical protein
VIGHLKEDHRMGRNHLAHSSGVAIDAVLAADTTSASCSSGSSFICATSCWRSPRRHVRLKSAFFHGRQLHGHRSRQELVPHRLEEFAYAANPVTSC